MTNHPNRSQRSALSPAPADIRAAREAAALTQEAAAAVVYSQRLAWARWESGDRPMHPAFWELFKLKVA